MGANIGTSITSTLVALGQVARKEEFRLSFAGATVHDMFNWLSVIVLLPIELITSYLEKVTGLLVDFMLKQNFKDVKEPEILTVITKPLTSLIVQLDKKVLDELALGNASVNANLIKHVCKKTPIYLNGSNLTNSSSIVKCILSFFSALQPLTAEYLHFIDLKRQVFV
jgi:sodium-dependent phosphate cotransporter